GKVRQEAASEAPYIADAINYYAKQAPRFLADEQVTAHNPLLKGKELKLIYRPFPLVGIISPWNFPILLSVGDAIPALAAGCSVLLKPSEFTPLAVLELVRGWTEDVGGPAVIEVVNGAAEPAVALIDESDFVQFTGSVSTAKKVMARAAETLTPISFELGGKDPMIVLDDADPVRAANGAAWGGLANAGQICLSVERVYVDEKVYDPFVEALVDRVRSIRQGHDEPHFTNEIGAMTNPAQIEIVEDHVADAVERGARVLAGGKRREGEGDFYEPTVLVDVDHSMKVMRDETFGPVVPVMKVAGVEEAVDLANDSNYGLAASVWGGKKRAEAVARRLEVGAANINDVLVNYVAFSVPMGGWKESGIGVRWGAPGIRKFCRTESLVITRVVATKSEPVWFPYSRLKGGVLSRLTRAVSGRGWRSRLGLKPRR
ncbi:MAG: aldehyde dehydrogenase family protein, partial [Solirubrobacterales bacterium]